MSGGHLAGAHHPSGECGGCRELFGLDEQGRAVCGTCGIPIDGGQVREAGGRLYMAYVGTCCWDCWRRRHRWLSRL